MISWKITIVDDSNPKRIKERWVLQVLDIETGEILAGESVTVTSSIARLDDSPRYDLA